MADSCEIGRASLLRWGLTTLVFAFDCVSPPYVMVPFFYALIPFVGKQGDKREIWLFALLSSAATLIAPILSAPPMPGYPHWVFWLNRGLASVAVVIAMLLALQQATERE